MAQTIACKSHAFAIRPIARKLFAALALGMLITACDKDDDKPVDPGNPGNSESFYASKQNMQLRYQDAADPSDHYTLSVTGQKDSAGGKVFNYRHVDADGSTSTPYVYAKGNSFSLVHQAPAEVQAMIDELENDPDVEDFSITGFPLFQKLPGNPQAGQAIEFSEPMHVGWSMKDEEEDEPIRVDLRFGFSDGRVVGFEDVTTPAGTFRNCMKIQFKTSFTLESDAISDESESQVTQWFAKGIGLVKSMDVAPDKTTTLHLTTITGR